MSRLHIAYGLFGRLGLGADALDAGQHFVAIQLEALKVRLELPAAGYVVVATQKLPGVTHLFLLAADCTLSCHRFFVSSFYFIPE